MCVKCVTQYIYIVKQKENPRKEQRENNARKTCMRRKQVRGMHGMETKGIFTAYVLDGAFSLKRIWMSINL